MIKPNEMRDYRRDIDVDPENLEEEWVMHPSIYLYYSELLAQALFDKDEAKLKLEWIDANIDLDIRKNYTKYDFESKPSEGGIRSTIIKNKKHREAENIYNLSCKKVNSLTGVKTAFEHKKHALSNLVSLRITGFHSEPRNKIQDLKSKERVDSFKDKSNRLNNNPRLKSKKEDKN